MATTTVLEARILTDGDWIGATTCRNAHRQGPAAEPLSWPDLAAPAAAAAGRYRPPPSRGVPGSIASTSDARFVNVASRLRAELLEARRALERRIRDLEALR